MNIDNLALAWRTSTAAQPDVATVERLTRESRDCARRYERGATLRLIFGSTAFVLTLATLLVAAMLPRVWPGMRFALLLWSASILACAIGLWRTRRGSRSRADMPLAECMRSNLQHIRHEIAYQQSLRWWFWVPFGIGFAAAMLWQPPTSPAQHPALLLGTAVLWAWGMLNGPRHWPRKLQPQADRLQALLDASQADEASNRRNGDTA